MRRRRRELVDPREDRCTFCRVAARIAARAGSLLGPSAGADDYDALSDRDLRRLATRSHEGAFASTVVEALEMAEGRGQ